jgi:hypothetical protein
VPRYHLKIKGKDLLAVKKEVRVDVKGKSQGQGAELTADLRAKNKRAAKALVRSRLPKGSDAKIGEPKEVKD